MKILFSLVLLLYTFSGFAQEYVIRDIKSFGAKGNGKTNDHAAFEKAAEFFNKRGGKGKLTLSKGTYIVGKQSFTQGKDGKPAYYGYDVLHFNNISDFDIEGKDGAQLRYVDSLKFGSFNPQTGLPFINNKYFVKYQWAALIGHSIFLENSTNVSLKNIELDGNAKGIILGGVYGDVGRQLPHYGLFIKNSKKIIIDGIKAHHFGLDGFSLANKASSTKDEIQILNSTFEYNARQGFSWIGGNDLKVKGCKFNHTGKGRLRSSPGAGVDVEAEVGPISNGSFENCEFINNTGVGMVADNGNSQNCTFKNCTFWGTTTWSIWVNKPAFTFIGCNIYGSIVHGYNAPDNKSATKFIDCSFEDKSFSNKPPYGRYLVESNDKRRVSFEKCSFVSNTKKLVWVAQPATWSPEEKYQFVKCTFVVKNANYPQNDFVAVIRGIRYQDCTFKFQSPEAKQKRYWLNECCEKTYNLNLGGNKVAFFPETGNL